MDCFSQPGSSEADTPIAVPYSLTASDGQPFILATRWKPCIREVYCGKLEQDPGEAAVLTASPSKVLRIHLSGNVFPRSAGHVSAR